MRRSLLWRSLPWRLLILVALACTSATAGAASGDASRVALVIGNAGYLSGPLPTAANDAGLVAQSLAQLGFDVTAAKDTDAATLRKIVSAFADQVRDAGPGAIVFVYLSGYGVQFGGENFIVPVDARIERQADVPAVAVPLAEMQHVLEALPARARLFVYDLARDNPIAIGDAVPLASGLTLVRPSHGSLYAFNAAPGTVAHADWPPYGLYARALAEMLRTPGLTAEAMFARVRLRMAELTSGAVVPWDDADLDADFGLLAPPPGPSAKPTVVSIDGLPEETAFWTAIAQDRLATYAAFVRAFASEGRAVRVKTMIAVRLEAMTWSACVRVDVPAAYWSYMKRYPRGPHYVDVRRRLAAIHAALEPPSRFDPYVFTDVPMLSPEPVRSVDRQNMSFDDPDGPPIPRMPDDLLPPAAAATDLELAPPPLVPVGVLPVPAPLPQVATKAWPARSGRISQPFVPGLGLVEIASEVLDDGTPSMTLSTAAGRIARTTSVLDKGQRTIFQTDDADEIISRTNVTRIDGTLVRVTQTGPRGEPLGQVVTHVDPLGERLTTIFNGQDQLIEEVRADRRGVTKEITRGTAVWTDATFVLPRLEARPAVPVATGAAPLMPSPVPAPPSTPTMPPAMPAFESPPPLPKTPSSPTGSPAAKPADVTPPQGPAPQMLPKVPGTGPAETSRSVPVVNEPAAVPLPVPRPPSAALKPRRPPVSSHGRK